VRASGRRRVKNSVEDCLYVLEVLECEWRDEAEESDDIDEESIGLEKVSVAVGLKVAV